MNRSVLANIALALGAVCLIVQVAMQAMGHFDPTLINQVGIATSSFIILCIILRSIDRKPVR